MNVEGCVFWTNHDTRWNKIFLFFVSLINTPAFGAAHYVVFFLGCKRRGRTQNGGNEPRAFFFIFSLTITTRLGLKRFSLSHEFSTSFTYKLRVKLVALFQLVSNNSAYRKGIDLEYLFIVYTIIPFRTGLSHFFTSHPPQRARQQQHAKRNKK